MTDEHSSQIPIDAHPDPVVAYAVGDDGARITAANEAFEAVPVDRWRTSSRLDERSLATGHGEGGLLR